MAIAQVQKVPFNGTTSQTTQTITITQPTQNNLMIVVVSASAVIDTPPSGFSLAVRSTNDTDVIIWYRVAPASFGTSVSWTDADAHNAGAVFFEYSGMETSSVLDKTATSTSTNNTGTTATTVQNDELLIGAIGNNAAVNNWSAWTNSFTEEADQSGGAGTFSGLGCASRIVAATGAYTTAATPVSGGGQAGVIATFKASAAVGATATPDVIALAFTVPTVASAGEPAVAPSQFLVQSNLRLR